MYDMVLIIIAHGDLYEKNHFSFNINNNGSSIF